MAAVVNKIELERAFVHSPGQARILTQSKIRDLFRVLRNSRDQAVFALGVYSGLRVGEIIALKYNQLYTAAGGVRTP